MRITTALAAVIALVTPGVTAVAAPPAPERLDLRRGVAVRLSPPASWRYTPDGARRCWTSPSGAGVACAKISHVDRGVEGLMADERVVCDAAQEKTARSGGATVLTRTCDAFSTREGEALVVLVAVAFDGTAYGFELDVRLKREDAAAAKGIDAFLGGVTLVDTRAGADANKAVPMPKPVKLPAWKDEKSRMTEFGLSPDGRVRWRYNGQTVGASTLETWVLGDAKARPTTRLNAGPGAAIAASVDGARFIVGADRSVYLVDAIDGKVIRELTATTDADWTRRDAAFLPDGRAVLVGWDFDGAGVSVTWLDASGGIVDASRVTLDKDVKNAIPHPDGSVTIRMPTKLVRVSRGKAPKVVALRDRKADRAFASDFLVRDTDGKRLLLVFQTGDRIELVDPETGKSVRNAPRGTSIGGIRVNGVADRLVIYSPGEGGASGSFIVWDPTHATETITLRDGLGAAKKARWRPVGALADLTVRFIEETGDGRFRQQPRMVDIDLSRGIPAALAAPCCPWTPPSRHASEAGTPIAIAPLAPRPGKPRGGGNKTPGAPVPAEGVATIKARMEADGWTLTTSKTASFAKAITLRAPVPPKEMNVCAQASRPMLLTVKIAAGGNTGQSTIPGGRGCSSAFVNSQGGAQTIDITVDTTSSGGASENATVLVFSR